MLHVEIVVNDRKFVFYNNSRNTRHGFAHDTECYLDGYFVGENHCYYLNRTWEKYRYQSVMMGWVSKEENERHNYNRAKYLHDNGYKKMTEGRKKAFEEWEKENDTYLKTLAALREKLSVNTY